MADEKPELARACQDVMRCGKDHDVSDEMCVESAGEVEEE